MTEPADQVVDDQGRPEPPVAANEADTLIGFLDFQRATLEWKCRGLDSNGLGARVGVSTMTLAGILKHMAWVELHWFSEWLHGREKTEPWASVDWKADPNWEWESAVTDDPDELRALWNESVEQARGLVVEAMRTAGLEQRAKRKWPDGNSPSLRWILVHMIEEYARHNGHADLLRESVDGETGE